MLKLPPFGKALEDLQSQGKAPTDTINVWIGNKAWEKGTGFAKSMPTRTLVLPPWEDPESYYWPINGCDMLIHDTGFAELDYLKDLAYCLYRDGADIVRCLTPDFQLIVFHKE